MGAFLENSLFFFVDDTEPILPIFRSPEYGDPGRIVEVTDVGCDTETTYPVHFLRNAFHRRRGGAESYGSTRRVSERLNERPNKFSRTITTILNNHQVSESRDREESHCFKCVFLPIDRRIEAGIISQVKDGELATAITTTCTSLIWIMIRARRIPTMSLTGCRKMILPPNTRTLTTRNSSIPEI